MDGYILNNDDPRLGTLTSEGKIATWPRVDFHLGTYMATQATIRYVDSKYFVVFSVCKDDPRIVISVADEPYYSKQTAQAQQFVNDHLEALERLSDPPVSTPEEE